MNKDQRTLAVKTNLLCRRLALVEGLHLVKCEDGFWRDEGHEDEVQSKAQVPHKVVRHALSDGLLRMEDVKQGDNPILTSESLTHFGWEEARITKEERSWHRRVGIDEYGADLGHEICTISKGMSWGDPDEWKPADINWSAWGSQDPETAERVGRALERAAAIAKMWDRDPFFKAPVDEPDPALEEARRWIIRAKNSFSLHDCPKCKSPVFPGHVCGYCQAD